jgi:hypothetical protein
MLGSERGASSDRRLYSTVKQGGRGFTRPSGAGAIRVSVRFSQSYLKVSFGCTA